jgi:hypothetical protein
MKVILVQFLNLEGYKCIASSRTHLNEQQCAHNLQTTIARCDEKIWDETLMEDGIVPSTTRNRK